MFFQIEPYLGTMKREILEANTQEEIDTFREIRVNVPVLLESVINTKDIPILGPKIHVMVDNMLFQVVSSYVPRFISRQTDN